MGICLEEEEADRRCIELVGETKEEQRPRGKQAVECEPRVTQVPRDHLCRTAHPCMWAWAWMWAGGLLGLMDLHA